MENELDETYSGHRELPETTREQQPDELDELAQYLAEESTRCATRDAESLALIQSLQLQLTAVQQQLTEAQAATTAAAALLGAENPVLMELRAQQTAILEKLEALSRLLVSSRSNRPESPVSTIPSQHSQQTEPNNGETKMEASTEERSEPGKARAAGRKHRLL